MSRGKGKAMASHVTPDVNPSRRREPMIDYFMENYWGYDGDVPTLHELGDMVRRGVTLTPELVDYVFRKHSLDGLRRWVEHKKPPKKGPQPWVYFIRVGDRVKIGTSVDPANRAVSLSLRVKDVLAVIEGDQKLERQLHKRFEQHRIDDTEWFHWCDEIANWIDNNADRFTRDHMAYRPHAKRTQRDGYAALARALDNGG
jgi:hypothetical protein